MSCFGRNLLPICLSLAFVPAFAEPSAVVGEATLVIGAAQVVGADGAVSTVRRGGAIHVGDRIETQAGGHVHLRFVDGGRISVRPGSRLLVENYSRAGSAQDAQGAIKFRLEEGVVRSITGAWGEAARERFRLNTPVAAIGVKGTDFVARSTNGVTYASVYTGAITMTPLEGRCAVTLGPCLNGAERLLAADSPGQVLELARQQATAQLVPVADQLARTYVQAPAVATAAAPLAPVVALASPSANTTPNSSSSKLAEPSPGRVDVVPDKIVSGEQHVLAALETAVPPHPTSSGPQFLWVRRDHSAAGDRAAPEGDKLSVAMSEAVSAGMVVVRSSLDAQYQLFRDPANSFNGAQLQGVKANFLLAGGAAQLTRPGGVVVEPASIDRGSLSVDFDRAAFETSLQISNRTINTVTLSEAGKIDMATGAMRSAHTSGAVSSNATSAAYSFANDLAAGRLNGITFWGR